MEILIRALQLNAGKRFSSFPRPLQTVGSIAAAANLTLSFVDSCAFLAFSDHLKRFYTLSIFFQTVLRVTWRVWFPVIRLVLLISIHVRPNLFLNSFFTVQTMAVSS